MEGPLYLQNIVHRATLTSEHPALYIVFKLFLKSRVVKLSEMDLQQEFIMIQEEKRVLGQV